MKRFSGHKEPWGEFVDAKINASDILQTEIKKKKGIHQMKVIRFDNAESYEPEKNWKRVSLCSQEDISIEQFVKPAGHASPRHEHPNAQVLIVLKGKLTITIQKISNSRKN
jgi:quercetin dioxygenase-like cupin family protein